MKPPDVWNQDPDTGQETENESWNEPQNYENVSVTYENLTVTIERIMVRPNGVFLIVTKNRSGRILGSGKDEHWTQYKPDLGTGQVQEKSLRNPIKQTKLHIFALSKKLSEIDCNVWIQGIVVFNNSRVKLETDTDDIPVLLPDEIEGFVRSHRSSREVSANTLRKINTLLKSAASESVHGMSEHVQAGETRVVSNSRNEFLETKKLAERHGYELPYEFKDNAPIAITKELEQMVSVTFGDNEYSINTYRAFEPEIRDFMTAWIREMGFPLDSNFSESVEQIIEKDVSEREVAHSFEKAGMEMTFHGSGRYGVFKVRMRQINSKVD